MRPSPIHNIGSWTTRRAQIAPHQPALADSERDLDYRGLDDRSARCAAWLASLGVDRGDRVGLLLGNRTAYLEAVFAAARLGAIAVPINARFKAPEVAALLADCRPRVLLHEERLADVAEAACAALDPPPALRACPGAYEAGLAACAPSGDMLAVAPDDAVLLMYTSGTTGRSKGALLPHRKVLYNSLNAQLFFGIRGDDRVLVILPLFHSFGLAILSLPALYAGAHVLLEPRFDAERCWQRVERDRVTYLGAVPTQLAGLRQALESADPRPDTRSLRFLFGAGSAVPVEQIRAFEAQGLLLKQGFGQTETSILCCLGASDAVRKAGSVGRPVFHADVRVVRTDSLDADPEHWSETAVGETGEIVVRGPINMLGYWERPEQTAATLRGEWLRTGDLATRDDEGFLTLVGRARDLYISGGENVYPAEVEAVYAEHPEVAEIAIVGVPHPRWGETGRAYVVLKPGARLDPEALRAWGAERLADFKLPGEFVACPGLPRTETGKVQKFKLSGAD